MSKSLLTSFSEMGVGNIGLKQLREAREITTQKWEATQMLDGLPPVVRENIAQLYENQLSFMILKESTDSGSSGAYETVAFPLIRRVFSKLLANDIVSVQALNLPIGKLYYVNPRISMRKVDGSHSPANGAFSNAATQTAENLTQFENRSLYDAYYATDYYEDGQSLFDRSKGRMSAVTGSVTTTGLTSGQNSYISIAITGFTNGQSRGQIVGPKGNVMDTESFLASFILKTATALTASGDTKFSKAAGDSIIFSVKPQQYGQAIVNKANTLELVVDMTYPGVNAQYSAFTFVAAPAFTFEYKDYSDLEEDSEMAEVSFGLDEVTVSVETRKMRAQWTPELTQDVSAFHNLDAEAELTALLSEQMAVEVDREILRDLRKGAAWTHRWDYNGLSKQNGTFFGTQKDWNQTLITRINQVSAQIKKSTLRGGATWVVVSPEVSAVFDDLQYFQVADASAESYKYNMGIEKIGTLSGRYQVFVDPYAPASAILIGHKGTSLLESGYIYAPYVPIMLTPVMHNFHNMSSVRGILTRYAKKMIFNRYYGVIRVDGLQRWDMQLG